MTLVESGFNSEQVSLMRPFDIEKCVLVLKQVVLIARVILISKGLYSGTLLYNLADYLPCSFFTCITHILLACLIRRKSLPIVIARSSSLSCQNFNVAHYLKSVKGINTKLGIPAHHDKMQLQDKGNNSEINRFGVMPLF